EDSNLNAGEFGLLPVIPNATGKSAHPPSPTPPESCATPISPASRETSAVGWPPPAVLSVGSDSQPVAASALKLVPSPEHTPSPQTSGASRPPARRDVGSLRRLALV